MKSPSQEITLAKVWNLTWPILIANLSIPLIGATNVAVMGRMPSPVYIGAVALGVIIFQSIYWGFAFLRSGTTGITAQAYGAGDDRHVVIALFRSLFIAFIVSSLVILLQKPIAWISFLLLEGSSEVEILAREYFDVRIWGSYPSLGNYALLGWFYGIHKPKLALALRVAMNVINIPLAIILALNLGMGVKGTALSAVSSNYIVMFTGFVFAFFYIKDLHKKGLVKFDSAFWEELKHPVQLFKIFQINSDIFLRTVLIFMVFSWFTSLGAKQGDIVLAANAVLINLYWFISYGLDSCSNAAEALVGQSIGARNPVMYSKAIKITSRLSLVFALVLTIVYFAFGKVFVSWLTTDEAVKLCSYEYLPWLIAMPFIAVWCFQLDGIFFGSTQTKYMRNMMLIAFVVFIVSVSTLPQYLGNNGLWLSFALFMLVRAGALYLPFRNLKQKIFADLEKL